MEVAFRPAVSTSLAAGALHARYVHPRRVRVLADRLAGLAPARGRLLDVGCGDGRLAQALAACRPGLRVAGIDVLVRPDAVIPVEEFDGRRIRYENDAFDAALCVDVLHHADDPAALLAEVSRVAPLVLLKDHLRDGWLAAPTLRLMDWVGNARHGIALPYSYMSSAEWRRVFETLGLSVEHFSRKVPLYPVPAAWLFGRGLHFVARLARRRA